MFGGRTMNDGLRGRRVEHAMSQLSRTPVVTALVRLMVLLGFAAVAWLVASASAHADAPAETTCASGVVSADSTSSRSTGSQAGAAASVGQPVESALAPVTRSIAGIVEPAAAATGQALAPVTRAVAGSTPTAGAPDACDGSSRQEGLLAPLGLSDVVTPLTDALGPLTDGIRPVLSGTALLRPVDDTVTSLTSQGSDHATASRTTPAASHGVPTPARLGQNGADTHQADASGTRVVHSFGQPAGATDTQFPSGPTGDLFPRLLGVAGSGGSTSGPTAPTHDGGTGAFVTGTSAADAAISLVTPATADQGAPRNRAEKLAVSPD